MDKILIHKDFIGYNSHLLINLNNINEIKKINYIPFDSSYILTNKENDFLNKSLNELLKLNGIEAISFPPIKYKNSMEVFNLENIPWSLIIPKEQYEKSIKKLTLEIKNKLKNINEDYYKNINPSTNIVLNSLQPAAIDSKRLNMLLFIEELPQIKTILESFKPNSAGFTSTVNYNRETKSGRLKVINGPNILNLKKEYRQIVVSRFGEQGKVYYLDYRSLEPRVALALSNNNQNIPFDVYSFVLSELNIKNISRDLIKEIVLSQLFGASEELVTEKLNGVSNPRDFINLVNDYFGLKELKEKLLAELRLNNNKGIKSFYGRWLETNDIKSYMLNNRFIQSTAVDVAMLGFCSIIKNIKIKNLVDKIIPTFILHDALILDVHKKYEDELYSLCEIGSNVVGFNNKFFLEYKELNKV